MSVIWEREGTRVLKKEWESEFFGRPMVQLVAGERMTEADLRAARREAALTGAVWMETLVGLDRLATIRLLEEDGYTVEGSRVTFRTHITNTPPVVQQKGGPHVRMAERWHEPTLLALTSRQFVNETFASRYNNRERFSEAEAEAYFHAWISSSFRCPRCSIAVAVQKPYGIVGYYIYHQSNENPSLYKGLLTAVDERARGQGLHRIMQQKLLHAFGAKHEEGVWVENVTQLSNLPALQNHMKAGRTLVRTELEMCRNLRLA